MGAGSGFHGTCRFSKYSIPSLLSICQEIVATERWPVVRGGSRLVVLLVVAKIMALLERVASVESGH